MSREFQDQNFITWEAYATTGKHGFPDGPLVVFNPISVRTLPPRYVRMAGEEVDAQRKLEKITDEDLRQLFSQSSELT